MVEYLDLIGQPFKKGGRGPEKFDCYGLVMELHSREDKIIPDYRNPETNEQVEEIMLRERHKWRSVWEKGDSVFETNFLNSGQVIIIKVKGIACHVGYVLDKRRFIHTFEGVGSVLIERISLWEKRIIGVYEYVG